MESEPEFSDGSDSSATSSATSSAEDRKIAHHNQYIALLITSLTNAIQISASGLYNKQAYHNSVLTGHAWILELLTGHLD